MRVKIFKVSNVDAFEQTINGWFVKMGGDIKIKNILYSPIIILNNITYTCMITYEEQDG